MGQPIRILLVEDNPNDAELLLYELKRAGFDPEWHRVDTEAEYLVRLQGKPEVILCDHSMPQFDGTTAFRLLKESGLDVPFISVSGTMGEEFAVEAMRNGVTDYLLKSNLRRLGAAVSRALEQARGRVERRRLEEQMRQAQKMEAVGQLAGGVAHDFNNILTVIQGYATLLEQGGMQNDEAAREISFAVDRAAGLSRQLLSLTRKQAMQRRLVDMNVVVAEMTKLLRRSIGEHIQLVVEAGENLPAIYADPGMIEQILLNLALNARDAMGKGGRLTIATSPSMMKTGEAGTPSENDSCPAVRLRVSDTGHGMSPTVRERVFEPFFTTKALNQGTGLGLTTVQDIVKQHSGIIRLHSSVGYGTTFEIEIPASKAEAAPASKPRAVTPVAGGRETILVVDDEPTLRQMIRMALKHFGYDVLDASSGQQAIELFEQAGRPVDLLLTDVVMPDGMSGQDLAEKMSARLPKLRVIYTSGYRVDLVKGLEGQEGMVFLQKPFSMQKLGAVVRESLDREG
jgi:two-component system, cell cycle sensor histidine kinase and response regulator CckA